MDKASGWAWGGTRANVATAFGIAALVLGAAAIANPDKGRPYKLHPYVRSAQAATPDKGPLKPLAAPVEVRDSPIAAAHDGTTPAAAASDPAPDQGGSDATPRTAAPATPRQAALPGGRAFWSAVAEYGYGASIAIEIGPDGAALGKTVTLTCRAEAGVCPPPPKPEGLRVAYRDREGTPYKSDADRRANWR